MSNYFCVLLKTVNFLLCSDLVMIKYFVLLKNDFLFRRCVRSFSETTPTCAKNMFFSSLVTIEKGESAVEIISCDNKLYM